MKRKDMSPKARHDAIAAFLDAQYAATHSNDIGPLLGQLSLLQDERPADATARRQWNKAASLALSGHASTKPH